jgi:DNA topoisomerase IB
MDTPRLRRSDPGGAGVRRRRCGRGFAYRLDDGTALAAAGRARIEALAIPPAWTDVWICPDERGHLQATGLDAGGRRQYLYHRGWHARRSRRKFELMQELARELPQVRARVAGDLARAQPDRLQVLACAVRLLDRGFMRIGGESYAQANGSYGLATLLREHVRVSGDEISMSFTGKGGVELHHRVRDELAAEVVRGLLRRRGGGPELLAHRAGRRWVDVRSTDVNAYLKELAGEDMSAKVFRTWQGTVLAAVALAVSAPATRSASARRRAASRAAREVALYLGNTPAVARASYIDPRLFDRFDDGLTIAGALDPSAIPHGTDPVSREAVEPAVLDLLDRDLRSPLVTRGG